MRERIVYLLKGLLFSYILTAMLILLMALGMYLVGISEKMVHILIIAIYVAATFFAGFLMGKKMQSRKFLWGLLVGGAYFLVLLVVSLAVNGTAQGFSDSVTTTFVLCAAGGMLGGMFS